MVEAHVFLPFGLPIPSLQLSHPGADSCSAVSDFEQSLSNMSIRRSRPNTAQPTSSSRPMRTVGSSPQLLPLKQIHEEQEVTSDDDALSTHSQTSVVKLRHSSLSMASPELARKLLVSNLHLVRAVCVFTMWKDNSKYLLL